MYNTQSCVLAFICHMINPSPAAWTGNHHKVPRCLPGYDYVRSLTERRKTRDKPHKWSQCSSSEPARMHWLEPFRNSTAVKPAVCGIAAIPRSVPCIQHGAICANVMLQCGRSRPIWPILALLLTFYAKKDREGPSCIALQLGKAAVHPCC